MSPANTTAGPPSRFIAGVVRWRLAVIGLWMLLVGVSATVYVGGFRIDNSVAIWFLEDDPELERYRSYNAEFGEREWTYLWLRASDGSVFEPAFLRDLQLLGDELAGLEHVHRVFELTDAGSIAASPGGVPRYEAFYDVPAGELADARQVQSLREGVMGSELFRGRLVSASDERFTVLAFQNDNLIGVPEPYRIELLDRAAALLAGKSSVADFGFVGTTVVNAELNRAARRDMFVFYALTAVFVLLVGALVLSGWRDLLVMAAVAVGTVLPVLGAVVASGLAFNLITIMLPTLLVAVAVSYLVHFLGEFHGCRRRGMTVEWAAGATFRKLLRPGLWTSVTTAVGFASLSFSSVAPVRQLGLLAAFGILLAWVNTLTIAPALLGMLWSRTDAGRNPAAARSGRGRNRVGHLLLHTAGRPRRLLTGGFALVVLAGAAGLPRLTADTDYVKFFKADNAVRSGYAQLREIGLPQSYLAVTVALPDGGRFADVSRHRVQLDFESALRALPAVREVESLDALVDLYARAAAGGEGDPGDRRLATLLVLAESGMMGEVASDFVSRDGGQLQLRVLTDSMSTRDIERFREDLDRISRDVPLPAGSEIALTGTAPLWANMDAAVVRTQLLSLAITAGVLLILLPLIFRSLRLGLLGFVVSLVPILCTLGLMAWIGLPVNIATCLLGGVVVGLSVDDTIYFIARLREGLGRRMPVGVAIRRALWVTGGAMVKTSTILIGGFLAMTASDFLPSVYFGAFFGVGISLALLADLILLPAMLRLFPPASAGGAGRRV